MPELPEVETIASQLRPVLAGAVVREVILHRPDILRTASASPGRTLRNRSITRVGREGKRIHLILDSGASCVIHLGMSGRLTMEPTSAPLLPHTHLVLRFRGLRQELRFRDPRRFGGVWLLNGTQDAAESLAPLGPDALSIRVPVLKRICRRRKQIKALLLDQHAIGGLGNIYCDEALYAARIHPLCSAADLTDHQIRKLACAIRTTLRRSIDSGGSTLRDYVGADGNAGEFQKILRVYGRSEEPCPRCGDAIRRIPVAGRSTHYCPTCQVLKRTASNRTRPRKIAL